MPDERRHRGRHPEDAEQFGETCVGRLRAGVADLSWLLTRDYATPSALKLVGDRYELTARQRTAVMRCACSDEALRSRLARELGEGDVAGATLLIDGYNVLTTIEAALASGVILRGRDGCYRDMASIHGSYRKVEETPPALELVGRALGELKAGRCVWYLDSPVSNSGRLKALIKETAAAREWPWNVEVVIDPDYILSRATEPVASADSVVLDRCGRWFSLARYVVTRYVAEAWVAEGDATSEAASLAQAVYKVAAASRR